MTPGTVVRVVNSYAATSEYTPARLLSSVDFPTDGKPTKPTLASPVFATSKPESQRNIKILTIFLCFIGVTLLRRK